MSRNERPPSFSSIGCIIRTHVKVKVEKHRFFFVFFVRCPISKTTLSVDSASLPDYKYVGRHFRRPFIRSQRRLEIWKIADNGCGGHRRCFVRRFDTSLPMDSRFRLPSSRLVAEHRHVKRQALRVAVVEISGLEYDHAPGFHGEKGAFHMGLESARLAVGLSFPDVTCLDRSTRGLRYRVADLSVNMAI